MAIQNTPPLSATYLNQQEARVSAALPAAGAWDATPVVMACPYFEGVTLTFTYDADAGAANPAVDWYVDASQYSVVGLVPAGGNEWGQGSIYAPGLVVAGTDVQGTVQREYFTYTPLTLLAESFTVQIKFNGPIERLRVFARESGDVANPGNLQVEALFW